MKSRYVRRSIRSSQEEKCCHCAFRTTFEVSLGGDDVRWAPLCEKCFNVLLEERKIFQSLCSAISLSCMVEYDAEIFD